MKINNSLEVARWESLSCGCGKDVLDSFPIKECLHCCFDQRWQSVPKKDFKVNEYNDKGKKIGVKTVKEITLVRGSKYEDVIGWQI